MWLMQVRLVLHVLLCLERWLVDDNKPGRRRKNGLLGEKEDHQTASDKRRPQEPHKWHSIGESRVYFKALACYTVAAV